MNPAWAKLHKRVKALADKAGLAVSWSGLEARVSDRADTVCQYLRFVEASDGLFVLRSMPLSAGDCWLPLSIGSSIRVQQ